LCAGNKKKNILILALDRMKEIELNKETDFYPPTDWVPQDFFSDVVGVTKSLNQKTSKVILKIDRSNAPYVLTKPIHSSQKLLKKEDDHIIIVIQVVLNFELEREILGFGESMEVLAPRILRKRIKNKIAMANQLYVDVSRISIWTTNSNITKLKIIGSMGPHSKKVNLIPRKNI